MKKKKSDSPPPKKVASNRRAFVKYEVVETLEAGIVLTGPEVKSLRMGAANMSEGFVRIENEQAYLWNVHISPYSHGSMHVEQNPLRTRKLLMNHREIMKWMGRTMIKGLTIVPLEIFLSKKGKFKVRIAMVKGKKPHDRRDEIKKRDTDRELRRQFADKGRA